jgi:competence protein ComEA
MKTFQKITASMFARVKWFGVSRLVGSVVSVVLVAGAGWWLVQVPPPPPEAALEFAPSLTSVPVVSKSVIVGDALPDSNVIVPQFLTVHVAGAVKSPGVYRLRQGARVNDGVDAAGGATTSADLDSVNLATLVTEGEQIYIPKRGEKPRTITSRPQLSVGDAGTNRVTGEVTARVININLASATQLEQLPGVGPATAKAIVAYREKYGAFNTVEDLLKVRGIGPAKLSEILPRASVR